VRRIAIVTLFLLLVGAGIWLFIMNYNHIERHVYQLNPGTPLATPVTCLSSGTPGPCILIVGGIHGNEPAGVQAAQELAEGLMPQRGRLVVVDVANPLAVAAGMRFISTETDLNRAFSIKGADGNTGKQAQAFWSLLEKERIDWVIDLHEAGGFFRRDETEVGQTLIFSPAPAAADLVLTVLDEINCRVGPDLAFTYLSPPQSGSLVREAWEQLGIPGLIVETCKQQELTARVAQQHLVVKIIVDEILINRK
jgi:predicted deacylase